MERKYKIFGPATGGAMTATGGGATEFFNLSGAIGNPISERLAREGQLQSGSPMVIPAPGGQPGVDNRDWRDKNKNTGAGGVTSTTSPGTPAGVGSAPGVSPGGSGGGGFGGGGAYGGGGRPTK